MSGSNGGQFVHAAELLPGKPDITQITDFFEPLAGDPLPEITDAATYNAFINSIIEFDIAPLPFSVGGDIPLLSMPSASVAPDLPLISETDEAVLLEGGGERDFFYLQHRGRARHGPRLSRLAGQVHN